ncbi:phage tail protein [Rhizobium sp. BK661]|uniref:phage tail protein n=1 Tax=Rhizobium sp. BK661 TaxID=2586991 RepID=UPI002167B712|nr:phage tail protein [Rhizobium sp. BK661]MCS3740224.1 phage-related protein [Rhizobium sp. BK661]
MLTFYPPIDPSPSTGRKVEFKLLKAEFGDGYTGIARQGINHRRRKLTLNWDVLTDEQADEITGFLNERGGDETFHYTPPREDMPVKWTCETYDDNVVDGVRRISAEFIQSFRHS